MSATQRKLIVMFADVSGSSALFERLGDKEAMHAVERCLKRMKRSIDGYKGRTIEVVGDELLATFEAAEDACQSAIDMQQRIADLPPVSGLKLTIRIGLHCGVVSDDGNKISGQQLPVPHVSRALLVVTKFCAVRYCLMSCRNLGSSLRTQCPIWVPFRKTTQYWHYFRSPGQATKVEHLPCSQPSDQTARCRWIAYA